MTMKLLIPVFSPATGTWGGLTRVIAIAQAAKEAGHQVAFCASGHLLLTLQQRGFTVYPTPSTTLFGLPVPLSKILEKRSQQVTLPIRPRRDFGNIWLVLLISGAARSRYLQRLVEAERHAAKDFNQVRSRFKPHASFCHRHSRRVVSISAWWVLKALHSLSGWALCNSILMSPQQMCCHIVIGPSVMVVRIPLSNP